MTTIILLLHPLDARRFRKMTDAGDWLATRRREHKRRIAAESHARVTRNGAARCGLGKDDVHKLCTRVCAAGRHVAVNFDRNRNSCVRAECKVVPLAVDAEACDVH